MTGCPPFPLGTDVLFYYIIVRRFISCFLHLGWAQLESFAMFLSDKSFCLLSTSEMDCVFMLRKNKNRFMSSWVLKGQQKFSGRRKVCGYCNVYFILLQFIYWLMHEQVSLSNSPRWGSAYVGCNFLISFRELCIHHEKGQPVNSNV